MINPTRILAVCFCLAAWPAANASSLFEDHAVIEVELAGPIHSLFKNRENRQELPFVIRTSGTGLDVAVRVRGNSRLRLCDFPPIRLNFEEEARVDDGVDDGAWRATVFDGQDKLKLVTHCHNSDAGERNVLEEYTAYRIFNLISDASYRVRLLMISYSDSDGKLDPDARKRHGFLLEPADQLAARIGGSRVQLSGIRLSQVNREQAALVYVFQYLIGNTDWSFVMADGDDACCHNGNLFEIDEELIYVPYDFDLAGIVNTKYAKPDPGLKLRNVRQRRYRGFCTDSESLLAAIHRVNTLREDIYQLVRDIPGLTAKDSQKILDYLQQFFDKAEDEEKLLKKFEKACID